MTQLYSVLGNSQKLDGGAMFGNVPRAMWEKWLKPDEQHRVPLACRCLLASNLAGKNVLFETGIGAFFEPKMRERFGVQESEHVLLKSLAEIGLSDVDIDVVVLSHLHFDHAGGLLAAWEENQVARLLFPNATFVISQRCWDRAKNPHARDRASFIPELLPLLEATGRVELVTSDSCQVLGTSVKFHFSEGHTPGLMLAEIVGAHQQNGIVFCADLIPGSAWVHVPVTMGYDRFPEMLIDEKKAFLADMLQRKNQLFFTHDPDVACAGLRLEGGKYFVEKQLTRLAGVQLY
jgi:glyoxylase-like metal-dependent hydrolase (beta-lactamase superfamily II)